MPRALVLGATGHIGAHIVRALLAEGHQVRAAYRSERFLSVLEGLPVERVRVDLDTLAGLPEALQGCDWVFHAAAYYPGARTRRKPAVAYGIASTQRVLRAIHAAAPSRVVLTSSAATIRQVSGRRATEEDAETWPLDGPRSLYATVKIAIEHEMRRAVDAGLPGIIVHPSICIGEYDSHALSGRLVLAYAARRLPCYLDWIVNVIYTGDVGVAHVRAAERGRVGERYLLTARDMPLRAFAELAAAAAGVPPPRWRLPYGVALSASWMSELLGWLTRTEAQLPRPVVHAARTEQRLDGTKAVRAFGLPETPIEEAVRLAVGWFSAHGYM